MLETIDIEPTSVCDLDCPFCFGPVVVSRRHDLPLPLWLEALLRFRKMGVTGVVISGGEPLLYGEILRLSSSIREMGYTLVVSTHGRNRPRALQLARYCDWISLPIDAVELGLTRELRTDQVVAQSILETAGCLKNENPSLRIKIGTVATARNLDEVKNIAELLKETPTLCDTWKIYQYTPRRKRKDNASGLVISDDVFFSLKTQIEKLGIHVNTVFSSNDSRRWAYLFVYHNGDVVLVNSGEGFGDVCVGNICRWDSIDFTKVFEALTENHVRNFQNTYG